MILSRSKRYDIDDYEERNKICRQMMSRGYEPGLIIQAINDIRSQR
jgi:SOS response regulatory protein OraA/RecX